MVALLDGQGSGFHEGGVMRQGSALSGAPGLLHLGGGWGPRPGRGMLRSNSANAGALCIKLFSVQVATPMLHTVEPQGCVAQQLRHYNHEIC